MRLLNGTVKKVTRDHIVVDFGDNAEGMLPREELVGREIFRINDRTRVILTSIRDDTRGPQLLVSELARNARAAVSDRSAGNF